MSKISDLQLFFAHSELVADGGTPATLTADAGSTVNKIIDAALTQADDYWNGALVKMLTGGNAGLWGAVKDFDAATDTLTLDADFPAAVGVGDTYLLLRGGNYRSNVRLPGLAATTPSNCGGSIDFASYLNGAGAGTLKYYTADTTMTWTPPGGTEGARVVVTAGNAFVLYGGGTSDTDKSKFVEVTAKNPLPVGNATDTITLTQPVGVFMPSLIGDETTAGATIYRLCALKNAHATDKIYSVAAYCQKAVSSAADTTTAGTLSTAAGTLACTDLANWPASGWVYNATKNDCRYYTSKSGNSIYCFASSGLRGLTAQSWSNGDTIRLMPEMDIGLDAPSSGEFENPASETTAPSGVTFSCPVTAATGLSIGDLAASDIYGIWERFTIVALTAPRQGALADLRLYAETTEE